MKKLIALAFICVTVAVLGTALTTAATDDASASNEVSATPSRRCCQSKSIDAAAVVTETPRRACCSTGETTASVLAEAASCSDDSCKAGDKEVGDCKTCGAAGAVSAAKPDVQKCGLCSEKDGKEKCSSCAEARKESAGSESEQTATAGDHQGMGHGHAGDSQHQKDHQDFFYLIEHRDSIRRTVKNIPNGVETLTESDVDDVASRIQVHVEAMYDRMAKPNPIRMRDPLFRAVFANADKIKMEVEHTDHGVRVKETSDDAYAVKLVQEHAKAVSLWIRNGYAELPKNHAAPQR